MKFVCLDCDAPMKLHETDGPHDGSLTVTFRCPECGFRVAMLTNPFETQMVKSLGVKVGGRAGPAEPFEHLRSSMARARVDAFEEAPAPPEPSAGPGCPFAAALDAAQPAPSAAETPVMWDAAAAARLDRIPGFIRPMAKRSIERFATEKGYTTITESVMNEARAVFGM